MDKKIVLVIDDDPMLLELMQKMLSDEYDVRMVNSASNALNYLNTDVADVILLDITMPNISGFDFLHDIREIPSYMTVPIIIVSGNSGQDFLREAGNSSAFDVLMKPVKKDVLVQTIEKSLAVKK